ncbi:MAG: Gfo/Idh/MocA family oxidoreductase [Acidimicrobiia bacterium]|nr:Gfo/Idh/MocA family oxidoreductase [Acidimicrobiia bacterium]
MVSEEIRYGVIGTGMMGLEHINNVNAIDGARVVAISDPDPQSRTFGRNTARIQDDMVFEDHKDLLAAGVCDAVVLVSPNHTHEDVMKDILATDVHVLVEKPLGTTVSECRRIIEAAEGHQGIIWMGLEYRYKPPIQALIHEVRAGSAGNIKMVAIREHRFPFLEKVENWNRFNRNTGGTLVEKCCHFFDLMVLIAESKPIRVYASGSQDVNHLAERYDGETPDIIDNAYVIVDFENGSRGLLDLCMFAEGSRNEQELAVTGDVGKIEAFVPEAVIRLGRRAERTVEERPVSDDHVAYAGLHEGASYLEHVDFIDAIRNGTPPKITLEDGLLAVAVGEAGHRSIDEGRPVTLSEVLDG